MKLTLKNYILVTLFIIAIIAFIGDCEDPKIFCISKILSTLYIGLFTHANFVRPTYKMHK